MLETSYQRDCTAQRFYLGHVENVIPIRKHPIMKIFEDRERRCLELEAELLVCTLDVIFCWQELFRFELLSNLFLNIRKAIHFLFLILK